MGNLWRRFWLMAVLPEELPEPDCPPIRLRILGEDLVAFRDSNGFVGIVQSFCPHRRAPLFFGRNEECGLRFVYHGWKFDVSGRCVDMPNEPPQSTFKDKIQLTAYPSREWGGAVWVYMGPPEFEPELPQLEWTLVPAAHRSINKWIQEANWVQCMEGDIDTSHVSFLHSRVAEDGTGLNNAARDEISADRHPQLTVIDTEYGFTYGGRRTLGSDRYYWRVTQWLLPTYSLIPTPTGDYGTTTWVPVDDHHTVRFAIGTSPTRPVEPSQLFNSMQNVWGPFKLEDGQVIDTYAPRENKSNLYGLDREMQRTINYSGMSSIRTQDQAMTEGMGYVCDRTQEHLGSSDLAVIAARRRLLKFARDLEQGIEPYAARHGELYRVRPLDIITATERLDQLLEEGRDLVKVS